jgi:hypothetical protein
MGRDWGGGGQFTNNLGPGWTRIAPHRKEGFQVGERAPGTRGLSRGIIKGSYQGVAPYASCCQPVHIYRANV